MVHGDAHAHTHTHTYTQTMASASTFDAAVTLATLEVTAPALPTSPPASTRPRRGTTWWPAQERACVCVESASATTTPSASVTTARSVWSVSVTPFPLSVCVLVCVCRCVCVGVCVGVYVRVCVRVCVYALVWWEGGGINVIVMATPPSSRCCIMSLPYYHANLAVVMTSSQCCGL